MSPLFDTHAHFTGNAEEIRAELVRAKAAGVQEILAVGGDPELNKTARLAAALQGTDLPRVYWAAGYDMSSVGAAREPIDCAGVTAVGELGLDYSHGETDRPLQRELLSGQLEAARQKNLPVIIHTREADGDTLGILREIPSRGVIHCFTGSPSFCRALLDLGFYVSISGIVTFKKADNVRESALVVPDDRLLIETDSPFLAPVPLRGKPNEPAFLVETARFLANLRGISCEKLADMTTANAHACFVAGSVSS